MNFGKRTAGFLVRRDVPLMSGRGAGDVWMSRTCVGPRGRGEISLSEVLNKGAPHMSSERPSSGEMKNLFLKLNMVFGCDRGDMDDTDDTRRRPRCGALLEDLLSSIPPVVPFRKVESRVAGVNRLVFAL